MVKSATAAPAKKYLVKIKRNRRWVTTIWTGHVPVPRGAKREVDDETRRPKSYTGKPVSRKAAEKAMARAQEWFPESEFKVVEAAAARESKQ